MPINSLEELKVWQEQLLSQKNEVHPTWYNGLFERYVNPVLTKHHTPLEWRYDMNPETNPYGMERLGINAVFNSGAIEHEGDIYLMARVEGNDRKSFFGLAKSKNGIDNFRFVDGPIVIPNTEDPDVNVYDMRLVKHEDGWIYGIFCSERKDPDAPAGDTSSATAQGGIVRSKDLINWERLPDFKSPSPQQRNVALHPEFVDGKYAFYTRPQDGFIDTGSGGGIGWGLSESMNPAVIKEEKIMHSKAYHTIYESKNGQGPAPIKTDKGWLHVAHGVRNCASGLRYVLYAFLSDLEDPSKVTKVPSGFLISADDGERVGDLVNVAFSNGMVAREDGTLLIYYATCDTVQRVAKTTVDKLLDYVLNTPEDPMTTGGCVQQRRELWERNKAFLGQ
jgi:4-O-beta-D-mannosyl-D-glucose phosphorylase